MRTIRYLPADRRGWPISILIDDARLFSNGMEDTHDNTVTYFGSGVSMRLTKQEADDFREMGND